MAGPTPPDASSPPHESGGEAHPPPLAPRLIPEIRRTIRMLHYSPRTEEAYIGWIRRYIKFSGMRHPSTLGVADARAFLSSLATEGKVSASTQNQALAALLFLYREVLRDPMG